MYCDKQYNTTLTIFLTRLTVNIEALEQCHQNNTMNTVASDSMYYSLSLNN